MADPNPYTTADQQPEVDLRDARLAAFLAWLFPGLGHLYQRRVGKGLLFMITIMATFAYGMYLGGGRVVYASTTNPVGNFTKFKERWHYACQLPIGLPALPAYVQTWRVENGNEPLHWFGDNFERPPYNVQTLQLASPATERGVLEAEYLQSTDQSKNTVLHISEREKWNHDYNYLFELGTVFTMIAGLMNVLAICDARWGPLTHLKPEPKSDDNANSDSST
ncbi:DUF6677 family protein [Aeoliella mucimassa]|uniref:DUF6677 domain-containing protein n=1 Tax=Aeoliella mucimassa TaxID=2527972 RepID=A0A518AVI1_9BACT|nr:DUF6677 family protein [Aeoliella mucimassa]QDU58734.1 hypothetical protein Pan181_49740 [Aeoliella mucimassa]